MAVESEVAACRGDRGASQAAAAATETAAEATPEEVALPELSLIHI